MDTMISEEDRQFERGLFLLEGWLQAHPGEQPGVAEWVGRWLDGQRDRAERGLLPGDRRARLEALGLEMPPGMPASVEPPLEEATAVEGETPREEATPVAEIPTGEASASPEEAPTWSPQIPMNWQSQLLRLARILREGEPPAGELLEWLQLQERDWRRHCLSPAQVDHLEQVLGVRGVLAMRRWLLPLRAEAVPAEPQRTPGRPRRGARPGLAARASVRPGAGAGKVAPVQPGAAAGRARAPARTGAAAGKARAAARPGAAAGKAKASTRPGAGVGKARKDPAEVNLQELERAGVPPDILDGWVQSGRLLPTRSREVFLKTRGLTEEIEGFARADLSRS